MDKQGSVVKTTSVELPALGFMDSSAERGPQNRQALVSLPESSGTKANANPAEKWRPLFRPPTALLFFLDDTGRGGEFVRLKSDSFCVGREEGDYLVPHDSGISTRHLEIQRVTQSGAYHWYVCDLDSTNGTFVKVDEAILKHGQEIYLGSRRYRFDAAPHGKNSALGSQGPGRKATQQWQVSEINKPESFSPSLVEITPEGDGEKHLLDSLEQSIGSDDSSCGVAIRNDPFVDPMHGLIVCRDNGDWYIEDSESTNGTWVRIDKLRIREKAMFLIGEQRFVLGVL